MSNNHRVSTSSERSVQAATGARRREATQTDILNGTRRLLLSGESFSELSINDIAVESGVSRATVYLHFADKKAIVDRLATEVVEQRFAIGAEIIADPHISREALDLIITDMVDRWVADAPVIEAIIALAESDLGFHEIWVDAIHTVGAMGAELMRVRWSDGRSSVADPDTLGQVLAWMFERSAHQLTRDPARRDAVIAAVAEVVWRVLDYRPAD